MPLEIKEPKRVLWSDAMGGYLERNSGQHYSLICYLLCLAVLLSSASHCFQWIIGPYIRKIPDSTIDCRPTY